LKQWEPQTARAFSGTTTAKEARQLVEAGFQYFTTIEGDSTI